MTNLPSGQYPAAALPDLHPGFLEHRRRNRRQSWEGFVRWSSAPGEQRIGWYSFDALRPVDDRAAHD